MQSARGTLLLKLCRDQRLQRNRIFLQSFFMPTPIMYYKSLPSHSASCSHQYSTACFSFPKNKLIYIKKKNTEWIYCSGKGASEKWCEWMLCEFTHSSAITSQPCCLPQHSFLDISCFGVYFIHPSTALFLIILLFFILSLQPCQSTWTQSLIWSPLKLTAVIPLISVGFHWSLQC